MKYISLTLAALLCAGSPLVAEELIEATEQVRETQENLSSNEQFVRQVRSQYAEGKYKNFLEEMEKDYQEAKKDGELEGLLAMRSEDAKIAAERASEEKQWNLMAEKWVKERNKELSKLISSSDTSLLAEKIRSVTTPEQAATKEAVSYFLDLRNLLPGEGKNDEENLLIERDLELEYKQMHLNSLHSKEPWTIDHQEKRLALRIEAMDKLQQDAQKFDDVGLKRIVATMADALDTYYIKHLDAKDLHRLATGFISPTGDLEQKAAAILSAYEGKFAKLTQEILVQSQDQDQ